ncbi:MAG: flagellar FlbD family protein [Brevinematia bacterium]
MVELTRLNDTKVNVNPFLIETIEETPDTVIVFNSGRRMVVKEKTLEIKSMFIDFLSQSIISALQKSRER